MADSRFHKNHGPFKLKDLAAACQGTLHPKADPEKIVVDVAALGVAAAEHISFLDNPRYIEQFTHSNAGACVIHPDYADRAPSTMMLILSSTPYRAYGLIAATFYPEVSVERRIISKNAHIDPTAKLGQDCSIAAGVVIGPRVVMGDRVVIQSNAVIEEGVEIGDDCLISANCVISHALIGRNVVFHPGAKVGQPGFGFFMDRQGHIKIPQLGRVVIHDDVEVGTNTTIDRGAAGDTVIGKGCRLDNLVQIAHNVHLGRGCVIVAQVGIAGSARLGDHVVVGGQVGIAGHITLGNHIKIAAQSGVIRDIGDNETVAGSPAVPVGQWHRQNIMISKLVSDKKGRE